jgi:hypothetical protein
LNLVLSAGFAVVAFLYAVVGHAGASGYIALMTLGGLVAETIKPVALILNIVVASIGCWNFLGAGHLPWRRIRPVYLLAICQATLKTEPLPTSKTEPPLAPEERLFSVGLPRFRGHRSGVHRGECTGSDARLLVVDRTHVADR